MNQTPSMTVLFTCPQCQSGIHVHPKVSAEFVQCEICQHELPVHFSHQHEEGVVETCPCCERKDFFKQKDFNRKIGVALFIIAAILSIFTYGISFVVLYLLDFFLFKKLRSIVICYKCQTIFRDVKNLDDIRDYDHEMNDRIVYSDHNFEGRPLKH